MHWGRHPPGLYPSMHWVRHPSPDGHWILLGCILVQCKYTLTTNCTNQWKWLPEVFFGFLQHMTPVVSPSEKWQLELGERLYTSIRPSARHDLYVRLILPQPDPTPAMSPRWHLEKLKYTLRCVHTDRQHWCYCWHLCFGPKLIWFLMLMLTLTMMLNVNVTIEINVFLPNVNVSTGWVYWWSCLTHTWRTGWGCWWSCLTHTWHTGWGCWWSCLTHTWCTGWVYWWRCLTHTWRTGWVYWRRCRRNIRPGVRRPPRWAASGNYCVAGYTPANPSRTDPSLLWENSMT